MKYSKRDVFSVIKNTILLILICLTAVGCYPPNHKDMGGGVAEITIDGCQYILYKGSGGVCHKGNCTNHPSQFQH